MTKPLLQVRNLRRSFPIRGGRGRLYALDGVDLEVATGECVAVVGESGSGKSTFGRCVARFLPPDSGEILLEGEDLSSLRGEALRRRRRRVQMVFQNPAAALDPRLKIGDSLREALRLARDEPNEPATPEEWLEQVGLEAEHAERFPSGLSGGQLQRVNLARALAVRPRLLILDEPVSALDVSVQAQILNLLAELRRRYRLTILLITHDLAVAAQPSERLAVFDQGKIVEIGPTREILRNPQHQKTAQLLAAAAQDVPQRKKVG